MFEVDLIIYHRKKSTAQFKFKLVYFINFIFIRFTCVLIYSFNLIIC